MSLFFKVFRENSEAFVRIQKLLRSTNRDFHSRKAISTSLSWNRRPSRYCLSGLKIWPYPSAKQYNSTQRKKGIVVVAVFVSVGNPGPTVI